MRIKTKDDLYKDEKAPHSRATPFLSTVNRQLTAND